MDRMLHRVGLVVLVGSIALVGAALTRNQGAAPQDPAPAAAATAAERYQLARAAVSLLEEQRTSGRSAGAEAELRWSLRLAESAVASGTLPPAQAYEQYVARMQTKLEQTESLFKAGRATQLDVAECRYALLEAKERKAAAK